MPGARRWPACAEQPPEQPLGSFQSPRTRPEMKAKRFEMNGGRGRNRTYNLSIKSRMLCQLSYASSLGCRLECLPGWEERCPVLLFYIMVGGFGENRTRCPSAKT
jgi:hypothetical protein